jgi:hypothetical protein
MQTLKLSLSLPDETHPDMELRLSANESDCDVVIALPFRPRDQPVAIRIDAPTDRDPSSANDDYVLGGYAGI